MNARAAGGATLTLRPVWLLAGVPLALALVVGAAPQPSFALLVLAAALGSCALLAVLARRFGVAGLWVLAMPLSILAGELGSVGAGGQSGRVLVADGVVMAGAAWALLRGRGTLVLVQAPFLARLVSFIVWAALGLLTSADPLTGIAELKEWVVAIVAAAAALTWAADPALPRAGREARVRLLVGGIVLSAVLVAGAMVVAALRHPLGPVLAVMMKQVDLSWGRTNYLAGILILAMPLALGSALAARSRLEGGLYSAALLACGVGLALSASKGAMLALVVTALPLFATTGRGMRRAMLAVLVLFVALALVFTMGPLKQVMAYRLAGSAIDYSMNERLDLYRLAWSAFLAHPLLGIGINNFSVASHILRGLDTVPHHLELGWLAELGLPGALFGLAALAAPLAGAWRLRRRAACPAERALSAGMLAAWAGMLAHNQVESTLYGGQYKLLLLLLAAAIAARTGLADVRVESPSTRGTTP